MNSKWILITGCSSGIGLYLTEALQKDGWRVIPSDKRGSGNILQLDLADSNSIQRAVKDVKEMTGGKLYALINNAGIAYIGKVEDITRNDLRNQFEVNVFGVHELTSRIIPIFKQNGEGRIINISSINGRIYSPLMGAYSASKFALEALTDAFRLELKGTGLKVSLIEPSTIETNFNKNAVYRDVRIREKKGKRPEIVYRKVRHALISKNPKIRYLLGGKHLVCLKNILPDSLFDKVISLKMPKP